MALLDVLLSLSLLTLILSHLLVTPYTKIEESFNLEATHDILTYGFPTKDVYASLTAVFDHVSYPGPVPRTFVGPLLLAAASKPILHLVGSQHGQFVTRAVLGLFNAISLARFKSRLVEAFGRDVGRWYLLLQLSQFHVIFYASRTLPNTFAFGLTTLALGCFRPVSSSVRARRSHQGGIFLLVTAGVIFRSEVAVLLLTQVSYMLIQHRMSLQSTIRIGFISAAIALAVSVPVDTYFYQRLVWPELEAFYFNAIQGNSSAWGILPWYTYFVSSLPRLLLNPLVLYVLIPLSLYYPATRDASKAFIFPSLFFVALYSFLPHKEPRFIIYVVPALTASASLAASYIWSRRSKSLLYKIGSLFIIASIAASLTASTIMLLISSLNYPGGEALHNLHTIIRHDLLSSIPPPAAPAVLDPQPTNLTIGIHTDILSMMTGVTLFLSHAYTLSVPNQGNPNTDIPVTFHYDKTEREDWLLLPDHWLQFDYALMEHPEFAIGEWEVVGTAWAYQGLQVLRPGVRAVQEDGGLVRGRDEGLKDEGGEKGLGDRGAGEGRFTWVDLMRRWREGDGGRFEAWRFVRDGVRLITGGWWVGPKMEPEIRVLRRVRRDGTLLLGGGVGWTARG